MKYLNKIVIIVVFITMFLPLFCDEESEYPKLGLVLSGGGAKGLAHIGVLKVLEEEGIQFDCITGTSMGSIVGGLYSIGYRTEDLEQLVTNIQWDDLLLDKISRSNLSMEEKQDENRYAGAFPIEGWTIGLPQGLVAGQQIQALLSKLMISVHDIEDFTQLPIPFLCIATDIEKGEAVILDHGYLPDAIRASMSIPSAFTPVELEGQLLVDGGLVRNFPVGDAFGLGADLIIGVDVAAPLQSKEKLGNLAAILNQSISLMGAASTEYQTEMVDLLIKPELDDFNILDFNDVETIILRGEEAARVMLPEIREFKKQLQLKKVEKTTIEEIDTLYVNKVYIQGLRDVSRNLVIGKLGINKKSWITVDDITEAVERVYGSGYFERVTYKLKPTDDGINLFIRCIEKTTNYLKFGIHYDNDMNSAVLLNGTFRNLLVQGSKLSMDFRLSENKGSRLKYFIHTGWKPGFGFGLTFENDTFDVEIRNENGIKEAVYDYDSNSLNLELQTIFSNAFTLSGFTKTAFSQLEPKIIPDYYFPDTVEYYSLSYGTYLLIDTMNKADYATKGHYLKASYENVFQYDKDVEEFLEPFSKYYFEYKWRIPVIDNLSYMLGARAGKIDGDDIPLDTGFYLGGLSKTRYTLLPFYGHEFMTISGNAVTIFDTSIQWEPWSGIYLTFSYNAANIGMNFDDTEQYTGNGVSVGAMTPLGPLQVTFMNGDQEDDSQTYLKIGYEF